MTMLVASAAAAWAMVGLIWMVQLVQYPMLVSYSELSPGAAAVDHQRRISKVVGPLMAVESVTAFILLVDRPGTMAAWSAWTAAAARGGAGVHGPGPSSPPRSPGRRPRQPSGRPADHHQSSSDRGVDRTWTGVGLGTGDRRLIVLRQMRLRTEIDGVRCGR
jgi:hypothetical protein